MFRRVQPYPDRLIPFSIGYSIAVSVRAVSSRKPRQPEPGVLPCAARAGHGTCATPGYGLVWVSSQCVPRLALSRTLCTKSASCSWDGACGGHGRYEQTQIDSDALHSHAFGCFDHVCASSAPRRAHTQRARRSRAPWSPQRNASSSHQTIAPALRPRCWWRCRALRRVPGCVSAYAERGVLAPCVWRLMTADM